MYMFRLFESVGVLFEDAFSLRVSLIQYKHGCSAASDFFVCLHNQLSSLHSISHIKEYRYLKKVIHQINSKNEWLFLSASFTAKFELVFVLTLENNFSQRFHFKANRKSIGSSKKRY